MGISFSNFGGTSLSTSTGFNLYIGSSGNNTFVFDTAQDAGGYSITSQLADTTFEFYAIAEDGTLAGYTNTLVLTTTKAFNRVVVYGATNNDLITFEFKPTTLPTSIGQEDSGAAPFVTSVSDADLANIDDTTIISGGNFATDVQVTFTGTDLVVRNAKSVVRTNSTQLIVTRPDAFLEDNSPYTVTVTNPGIPQSAYKSFTSSITAGGDPVWVTASGALSPSIMPNPYSATLEATDPDGGDITYSITAGQLPSGLSLDASTGIISGIPDAEIQVYSFTVTASDPNGNATNRSFSISVDSQIIATGGTITEADGYRYHIFTSSQEFSVSNAGDVEVLLVGGGAGGNGGHSEGGGGGATSVTSLTLSANSYNIVVGDGGAAASNTNNVNGGNGGTTSAFGISVAGGRADGIGPTGAEIGSLGLGAGGKNSNPRTGGDGSYYSGFTVAGSPAGWYGGGGGGAGGVGYETSPGGAGGKGGGGYGGTGYQAPPVVAVANTGGAGGSGGIGWCGSVYCGGSGTRGASGIVIVRYPI